MNDVGIHIGKIYSEALFELAGGSNMVDTVKYNLDGLADVIAGEKDFALLACLLNLYLLLLQCVPCI